MKEKELVPEFVTINSRLYRLVDETIEELPENATLISNDVFDLNEIKVVEIRHCKDIYGNEIERQYCIILETTNGFVAEDIAKYGAYLLTDRKNRVYRLFAKFIGNKRVGVLHEIHYELNGKIKICFKYY